jgi:hypothetical protein
MGDKWWVAGGRIFEPGDHMKLQMAGIVTVCSIRSFGELENIVS